MYPLNHCITLTTRLKNTSIENDKDTRYAATTIKIDFFSGYDVVSVNGLYGHQNIFGGWKHEQKYHYLLVHLRKVNLGWYNLKYTKINWNYFSFWHKLYLISFSTGWFQLWDLFQCPVFTKQFCSEPMACQNISIPKWRTVDWITTNINALSTQKWTS